MDTLPPRTPIIVTRGQLTELQRDCAETVDMVARRLVSIGFAETVALFQFISETNQLLVRYNAGDIDTFDVQPQPQSE